MIISFYPQHPCDMDIQTHFMDEETEAPRSKSTCSDSMCQNWNLKRVLGL